MNAPGTVACKQSTEPFAMKSGSSQKPLRGYRLRVEKAAKPHEGESPRETAEARSAEHEPEGRESFEP